MVSQLPCKLYVLFTSISLDFCMTLLILETQVQALVIYTEVIIFSINRNIYAHQTKMCSFMFAGWAP